MWLCIRAGSSLLVLVLACFGQASEYNSIYRGAAGEVFSRKPNAFLVEMVRGRKAGKALDVGMGEGRNSLFLAGAAVSRETSATTNGVLVGEQGGGEERRGLLLGGV